MEKLIGIGLYREDQWRMLLETADDIEEMEREYDEWMKGMKRLIQNIRKEGIEPVIVNIDMYDLQAFCREHNLKNNGQARSQFVAELLRNRRAVEVENNVLETCWES